jgi:aerobic-type carbon monoxide dehydrogenase small subunit (CoxS/CutS family)
MPIEVYSFIGSSPIRHMVEGWGMDFLVKSVTDATAAAVRNGLKFCLVTEDTTRSDPAMLRTLFKASIDAGASRLCLCDTTGHVTPYGAAELVLFTRGVLKDLGATHVELDWHAHNDRGLAVATALWAASDGVERIHGTGLGVGERVGNSCMELLIDNLARMGSRRAVSRDAIADYAAMAARVLRIPIAPDHPVAGPRYVAEQRGARTYRVTESITSSAATPLDDRRDPLIPLRMRVSGQDVELAVHPRRTLLEALRYDLDLVATKQGCDKGDCGACTVVMDGRAVLSCLTLALEAEGKEITTAESMAGAPHFDPLLDCFDRAGGGQCGFCTPGMLMSATALLDKNPSPTRDEIKLAISGNLCRCTGYGRIVDAIELAARLRRKEIMPDVEPNHLPPALASNEEKRSKRTQERS